MKATTVFSCYVGGMTLLAIAADTFQIVIPTLQALLVYTTLAMLIGALINEVLK